MNAHVMAGSHLTGPNRLPRWVRGNHRDFCFGLAGFVRKFNALRMAMRMSQTYFLTSHVDRVRNDVKLMGQVPPNGTQQVTPLGRGGLSRICFGGVGGL